MAELQAFGFDPKSYQVTVVAWVDTLPAWNLWAQVGNQWRMGMGGAFALDYNVLFSCMERLCLAQEDYDDLFEDIRIIESEVLEVWAEERERADEEAKRRK